MTEQRHRWANAGFHDVHADWTASCAVCGLLRGTRTVPDRRHRNQVTERVVRWPGGGVEVVTRLPACPGLGPEDLGDVGGLLVDGEETTKRRDSGKEATMGKAETKKASVVYEPAARFVPRAKADAGRVLALRERLGRLVVTVREVAESSWAWRADSHDRRTGRTRSVEITEATLAKKWLPEVAS